MYKFTPHGKPMANRKMSNRPHVLMGEKVANPIRFAIRFAIDML